MTKNRGWNRPSKHINRRVTQSIFRAVDYAQHAGVPLNLYAVINFRERADISAGTAFNRLRHKFRDWLVYRTASLRMDRQPPAYVYSFENQNGMVHVNWMVHVPKELQVEFQRKLRGWQKKVQGCCDPFDVKVQPVKPDYAKKLAKYVVKGTDPAFVDHFYLAEVASDQGEIVCKRAGASPGIGPTARRAAGFRKPRRRFTTSQ